MAKPIHEIMAEASASKQQPFGGNLERYNVRPTPTAEQRRSSGEVGQWQRDVNTGLRSLLPWNRPGELTGVSWPGGMERYQRANHPLNEASAWPALGSDRINKWDMTGGPNVYNRSFPRYETWTGGMGLQGSQGYPDYGAYHEKWGYPTDMLEVKNLSAIAEQSAKYPLGEFSGTEFPPRPLDYDADEFVGTPVERYQPAPGTEYNPMEHIEYDALHMMNPYDAEEFQPLLPPEMLEHNLPFQVGDIQDDNEAVMKLYERGLSMEEIDLIMSDREMETTNLGNYDLFHLMQNGYSLEEAQQILSEQGLS